MRSIIVNAVLLGTLVTVALTSATASTTIMDTIPVEPVTTVELPLPPASNVASTTVTTIQLPSASSSEAPACEMQCGYVSNGGFCVKKMCWCQTPEELKMASAATKSTSPSRLLLVLVALVAVALASDWIPAVTRTETTTYTIMLPASTVTKASEAETMTKSVTVTEEFPTPVKTSACQLHEETSLKLTSGASRSKVPRSAVLVLSFLTAVVLGWPTEKLFGISQAKPLIVTTTVEQTVTKTQLAATVTTTRETDAKESDSSGRNEEQGQLPDFEDWILDAGKMAGKSIHDVQ